MPLISYMLKIAGLLVENLGSGVGARQCDMDRLYIASLSAIQSAIVPSRARQQKLLLS